MDFVEYLRGEGGGRCIEVRVRTHGLENYERKLNLVYVYDSR